MNDLYLVYCYENEINHKRYIGMTHDSLKERAGCNGVRYKKCKRFYSDIKKFGWDSFKPTVLFETKSKEEAEKKEIEMIKKYNTKNYNFGYNVANGGLKPPLTPSGEDNPFFGKHHKPYARQRVAEANKRRVWTEESKTKLREKLKGANSPCAKTVVCIESGKVYKTVKEAAMDIGVTPSRVCDVLKGNRKHAKGFHFQYCTNAVLQKPNDYPETE